MQRHITIEFILSISYIWRKWHIATSFWDQINSCCNFISIRRAFPVANWPHSLGCHKINSQWCQCGYSQGYTSIFHNSFLGCPDACEGVHSGRWLYAGDASFTQRSVYPNRGCQNENKVLQRDRLLRNSVRVMKDLCFLMVYLGDISFLLFASLSNVLLLSIVTRDRYVSSQVETHPILVREDFCFTLQRCLSRKRFLKRRII